jgi:hypothetical protein
MNRLILLVIVVAVGCGSGAAHRQPASLELVAPGAPIEMQGGETREIQLLVIGIDADQASFSADLPPFAKLVGSVLTLFPSRVDAGDYAFTITAAAGDSSSQATIHVIVTSPNTAPTWQPWDIELGDDLGIYNTSCPPGFRCEVCPSASCELEDSPSVYLSAVCDAEDDMVTVDVEVVRVGQQFTKTATNSYTGQVGRDQAQSGRCLNGIAHCSCFQILLTGLAPATSYEFAVRVSDARGLVATFPDAADGWVSYPSWQFSTHP